MDKPSFIHRDSMISDRDYIEWLLDIKQRLQKIQIKAAIQVNSAMLEFYWSLGRDLVEKTVEQSWGVGVVKH